jgi:glucose 1-dehydrogenase
MDLTGQCAVVTGGSSGIGKACALALSRAGASVAITYHKDGDEAEGIIAAIREFGGQAIACKADVGQEQDVEALFAAAEEAFGPVRLLVNSAGVNMAGTPIKDMSVEQFEGVLRTDLTGPFLCCRRFVRGLDDQERIEGCAGRIVNISSIHERAPRPGAADYDSAKGGLAQLTATLALELAPLHIAVNGVAPGMILTPMNQSAIEDPDELKRKEASIPWGRAGTPDDVAELTLFLLSKKADYITGTTVTIDGALSLVVAQGA